MAQFDYFRYGDGFLLDVQTELLGRLSNRMVVPLLPESRAPRAAVRLNPIFVIDGERMVMATQFMASVPASELGERAGSLADAYDVIKPAIDFLFDGF